MAEKRNPLPFEPRRSASETSRNQAIPRDVANRMARRVAISTGVPSLMGMAVFVISYLVVSRGILDVPPSITLVTSGFFFLLGLVGLSYGVLSASWESQPGSLLGLEHLKPNLQRLRSSIKAQKQA
tara:strand:- start:82 stop:459 length:378 start_codon:yes stop_codon:yes gene_type:complete